MIGSARFGSALRRRLPTPAEASARALRLAEEAALWWRLADRPRVVGALLGLSAPLVIFGNTVLAVLFGLATIAAAPALRDRILRWRLQGLIFTPAGALGLATGLWWAATCLFSQDPWGSAEVVLRIAAFIAAACLIVMVLAERADARRLGETCFLVAFAACTVAAAIAMYGAEGLLRAFAPFTRDLTDPLTFFKSYMSVVALATPAALWIGWRRGGWLLACALASLIAGGFLIWGNGLQTGRAALGGLAAAAASVLLVRLMRRASPAIRRASAASLMAGAVALGGIVMLQLPAPPITEEQAADPPLPVIDLHRQAIWGFALDKALERPILGFGVNTINEAPGANEQVLDLNQEYIPSHPHNWVLEVFAETGAPGVLLLLASQLALALAFARQALTGRAGGYAALAVLAAFWVSSLANFSIWSAWWQIVFLACAALPAARLMGPTIVDREADAVPAADWRRIALCALALTLAALLALVWYARKTEEGYILYKRLFAESEFIYDDVRPEIEAVDPASLIRPEDAPALAAIRADVIAAIWGEAGLPAARGPAQVTPHDQAAYGLGRAVSGLQVERVEIPIEANYQSVGWILTPPDGTGRAVIYNHGYAGDVSQAQPLIDRLLRAGFTVAALNFPGYAENAYQRYDHPRFGPINFDHDFLLFFADRPLRFYIEPPIVVANHLRRAHGARSVDVIGFSAGGWVSATAAAVDPRFARSASVASFLPLYMRDRTNSGEWTPPHLYPPLLQATNYLEIPLLAAVGEDRAYLQIFNRYDRCCYRNRLGRLYEPAIKARLETLGQGGAFQVLLDESHARHEVSAWSGERLVDFLTAERGRPEDEN
ncbi:MAG: hypothetical protein RIB45_10480 [Marivibrio sp.]|uniref:alpha/beta fold hydrolase n=1 Tax=Marivibrio sp. TaxID=2039719 RepID=UPI0032EB9EB8